MTELTPSQTAKLAESVYAVNKNDERSLKLFLQNQLFCNTENDKPNILSADVGGRIFRHAKDNFGVMAKGSGHLKNDIFFIFRGTTDANNKADVVTDARIGICLSKSNLPVHIGFNHAFNSMLPEIREFLKDVDPGGTIHCIGHSLGGAVASLAADWASNNLNNPIKLYTYGAPRVGTDWFSKSTTQTIGQKNIHRTYHKTDPVPMVAIYPFVQAPYGCSAHYLPSNDPLTSGKAHKMENYVKSVKGRSWIDLSKIPIEPYDIEIAIENWLKSKSPVDPTSASFWQWVNSALTYVIRKVAIGAMMMLQGTVMGLHTIIDKLAYILAKGINLAESISQWVVLLMEKIMAALRIATSATKEILTKNFIKNLLVRLASEANKNASKAIRDIE